MMMRGLSSVLFSFVLLNLNILECRKLAVIGQASTRKPTIVGGGDICTTTATVSYGLAKG